MFQSSLPVLAQIPNSLVTQSDTSNYVPLGSSAKSSTFGIHKNFKNVNYTMFDQKVCNSNANTSIVISKGQHNQDEEELKTIEFIETKGVVENPFVIQMCTGKCSANQRNMKISCAHHDKNLASDVIIKNGNILPAKIVNANIKNLIQAACFLSSSSHPYHRTLANLIKEQTKDICNLNAALSERRKSRMALSLQRTCASYFNSMTLDLPNSDKNGENNKITDKKNIPKMLADTWHSNNCECYKINNNRSSVHEDHDSSLSSEQMDDDDDDDLRSRASPTGSVYQEKNEVKSSKEISQIVKLPLSLESENIHCHLTKLKAQNEELVRCRTNNFISGVSSFGMKEYAVQCNYDPNAIIISPFSKLRNATPSPRENYFDLKMTSPSSFDENVQPHGSMPIKANTFDDGKHHSNSLAINRPTCLSSVFKENDMNIFQNLVSKDNEYMPICRNDNSNKNIDGVKELNSLNNYQTNQTFGEEITRQGIVKEYPEKLRNKFVRKGYVKENCANTSSKTNLQDNLTSPLPLSSDQISRPSKVPVTLSISGEFIFIHHNLKNTTLTNHLPNPTTVPLTDSEELELSYNFHSENYPKQSCDTKYSIKDKDPSPTHSHQENNNGRCVRNYSNKEYSFPNSHVITENISGNESCVFTSTKDGASGGCVEDGASGGCVEDGASGGCVEDGASGGCVEDDASGGCVEDDASGGCVEDDASGGCVEDDASGGCVEDDASGGCVEDDASGGCVEDDASGGCVEDDASGGCVEDDASGGCVEDDASGGCVEDDANSSTGESVNDSVSESVNCFMEGNASDCVENIAENIINGLSNESGNASPEKYVNSLNKRKVFACENLNCSHKTPCDETCESKALSIENEKLESSKSFESTSSADSVKMLDKIFIKDSKHETCIQNHYEVLSENEKQSSFSILSEVNYSKLIPDTVRNLSEENLQTSDNFDKNSLDSPLANDKTASKLDKSSSNDVNLAGCLFSSLNAREDDDYDNDNLSPFADESNEISGDTVLSSTGSASKPVIHYSSNNDGSLHSNQNLLVDEYQAIKTLGRLLIPIPIRNLPRVTVNLKRVDAATNKQKPKTKKGWRRVRDKLRKKRVYLPLECLNEFDTSVMRKLGISKTVIKAVTSQGIILRNSVQGTDCENSEVINNWNANENSKLNNQEKKQNWKHHKDVDSKCSVINSSNAVIGKASKILSKPNENSNDNVDEVHTCEIQSRLQSPELTFECSKDNSFENLTDNVREGSKCKTEKVSLCSKRTAPKIKSKINTDETGNVKKRTSLSENQCMKNNDKPASPKPKSKRTKYEVVAQSCPPEIEIVNVVQKRSKNGSIKQELDIQERETTPKRCTKNFRDPALDEVENRKTNERLESIGNTEHSNEEEGKLQEGMMCEVRETKLSHDESGISNSESSATNFLENEMNVLNSGEVKSMPNTNEKVESEAKEIFRVVINRIPSPKPPNEYVYTSKLTSPRNEYNLSMTLVNPPLNSNLDWCGHSQIELPKPFTERNKYEQSDLNTTSQQNLEDSVTKIMENPWVAQNVQEGTYAYKNNQDLSSVQNREIKMHNENDYVDDYTHYAVEGDEERKKWLSMENSEENISENVSSSENKIKGASGSVARFDDEHSSSSFDDDILSICAGDLRDFLDSEMEDGNNGSVQCSPKSSSVTEADQEEEKIFENGRKRKDKNETLPLKEEKKANETTKKKRKARKITMSTSEDTETRKNLAQTPAPQNPIKENDFPENPDSKIDDTVTSGIHSCEVDTNSAVSVSPAFPNTNPQDYSRSLCSPKIITTPKKEVGNGSESSGFSSSVRSVIGEEISPNSLSEREQNSADSPVNGSDFSATQLRNSRCLLNQNRLPYGSLSEIFQACDDKADGDWTSELFPCPPLQKGHCYKFFMENRCFLNRCSFSHTMVGSELVTFLGHLVPHYLEKGFHALAWEILEFQMKVQTEENFHFGVSVLKPLANFLLKEKKIESKVPESLKYVIEAAKLETLCGWGRRKDAFVLLFDSFSSIGDQAAKKYMFFSFVRLCEIHSDTNCSPFAKVLQWHYVTDLPLDRVRQFEMELNTHWLLFHVHSNNYEMVKKCYHTLIDPQIQPDCFVNMSLIYISFLQEKENHVEVFEVLDYVKKFKVKDAKLFVGISSSLKLLADKTLSHQFFEVLFSLQPSFSKSDSRALIDIALQYDTALAVSAVKYSVAVCMCEPSTKQLNCIIRRLKSENVINWVLLFGLLKSLSFDSLKGVVTTLQQLLVGIPWTHDVETFIQSCKLKSINLSLSRSAVNTSSLATVETDCHVHQRTKVPTWPTSSLESLREKLPEFEFGACCTRGFERGISMQHYPLFGTEPVNAYVLDQPLTPSSFSVMKNQQQRQQLFTPMKHSLFPTDEAAHSLPKMTSSPLSYRVSPLVSSCPVVKPTPNSSSFFKEVALSTIPCSESVQAQIHPELMIGSKEGDVNRQMLSCSPASSEVQKESKLLSMNFVVTNEMLEVINTVDLTSKKRLLYSVYTELTQSDYLSEVGHHFQFLMTSLRGLRADDSLEAQNAAGQLGSSLILHCILSKLIEQSAAIILTLREFRINFYDFQPVQVNPPPSPQKMAIMGIHTLFLAGRMDSIVEIITGVNWRAGTDELSKNDLVMRLLIVKDISESLLKKARAQVGSSFLHLIQMIQFLVDTFYYDCQLLGSSKYQEIIDFSGLLCMATACYLEQEKEESRSVFGDLLISAKQNQIPIPHSVSQHPSIARFFNRSPQKFTNQRNRNKRKKATSATFLHSRCRGVYPNQQEASNYHESWLSHRVEWPYNLRGRRGRTRMGNPRGNWQGMY